jgi:hypothetical protein
MCVSPLTAFAPAPLAWACINIEISQHHGNGKCLNFPAVQHSPHAGPAILARAYPLLMESKRALSYCFIVRLYRTHAS